MTVMLWTFTEVPAVAEAAWIESLAFASAVLIFLALISHLGLPHLLEDQRTVQGLAFIELCVYVLGTVWWLIGAFVSAAFAARIAWSNYSNFTTAAAIACILCVLTAATFAAHAIANFLQWSGRPDQIPEINKRSSRVNDSSAHIQTPANATPLEHQSA